MAASRGTRWIWMLVALGGCRQIFGLGSPVVAVDAAVEVDALDAHDPCTGHDEDGDAVVDVCDICPGHSNVDQQDGDGDGVGDLCDPHPSTGGDRMVFFEGFETAPIGWRMGGDWEFSNDQATGRPPATNVSTLFVPYVPTAHETISARVTVIAKDGDDSGQAITITTNYNNDPGTVSAVSCSARFMPAPMNLSLDGFMGSGVVSISSTSWTFAPGNTLELRLRRNGTAYTCEGTNGSTAAVMTTGAYPGQNDPPITGMRAVNTTAGYHWFMVVASP